MFENHFARYTKKKQNSTIVRNMDLDATATHTIGERTSNSQKKNINSVSPEEPTQTRRLLLLGLPYGT